MAGEDLLAQVVGRMDPGATLLRAWPLAGGVSAQVMGLEIQRADGSTQKLVLRRHGDVDLRGNPQIAADEFRLLTLLHRAGLPVAAPRFLDQACDLLPTPYLILDFLDGESDFSPSPSPDRPHALAAGLAQIHKIDLHGGRLSFLPNPPPPPDQPPQRNGLALLHGDFWPGNVLWQAGRLTGIIDWEDARLGDPVADVANSRLEILWAYGAAAMTAFTQRYAALNALDFTELPRWDRWIAQAKRPKIGDWGLDENIEQAMYRDLAWFVDQAAQDVK